MMNWTHLWANKPLIQQHTQLDTALNDKMNRNEGIDESVPGAQLISDASSHAPGGGDDDESMLSSPSRGMTKKPRRYQSTLGCDDPRLEQSSDDPVVLWGGKGNPLLTRSMEDEELMISSSLSSREEGDDENSASSGSRSYDGDSSFASFAQDSKKDDDDDDDDSDSDSSSEPSSEASSLDQDNKNRRLTASLRRKLNLAQLLLDEDDSVAFDSDVLLSETDNFAGKRGDELDSFFTRSSSGGNPATDATTSGASSSDDCSTDSRETYLSSYPPERLSQGEEDPSEVSESSTIDFTAMAKFLLDEASLSRGASTDVSSWDSEGTRLRDFFSDDSSEDQSRRESSVRVPRRGRRQPRATDNQEESDGGSTSAAMTTASQPGEGSPVRLDGALPKMTVSSEQTVSSGFSASSEDDYSSSPGSMHSSLQGKLDFARLMLESEFDGDHVIGDDSSDPPAGAITAASLATDHNHLQRLPSQPDDNDMVDYEYGSQDVEPSSMITVRDTPMLRLDNVTTYTRSSVAPERRPQQRRNSIMGGWGAWFGGTSNTDVHGQEGTDKVLETVPTLEGFESPSTRNVSEARGGPDSPNRREAKPGADRDDLQRLLLQAAGIDSSDQQGDGEDSSMHSDATKGSALYSSSSISTSSNTVGSKASSQKSSKQKKQKKKRTWIRHLRKVNRHGDDLSVGSAETIETDPLDEGRQTSGSHDRLHQFLDQDESTVGKNPWRVDVVAAGLDDPTRSFRVKVAPQSATSDADQSRSFSIQLPEDSSLSGDSEKQRKDLQQDELAEMEYVVTLESLRSTGETQEDFDQKWDTLSMDQSAEEIFNLKQQDTERKQAKKKAQRAKLEKEKKARQSRLRLFRKKNGTAPPARRKKVQFTDEFVDAMHTLFDETSESMQSDEDDEPEVPPSAEADVPPPPKQMIRFQSDDGSVYIDDDAASLMEQSRESIGYSVDDPSATSLFQGDDKSSVFSSRQQTFVEKDSVPSKKSRARHKTRRRKRRIKFRVEEAAAAFEAAALQQQSPKPLTIANLRQEMAELIQTDTAETLEDELRQQLDEKLHSATSKDAIPPEEPALVEVASTTTKEGSEATIAADNDWIDTGTFPEPKSRWDDNDEEIEDDLCTVVDEQHANLFGVFGYVGDVATEAAGFVGGVANAGVKTVVGGAAHAVGGLVQEIPKPGSRQNQEAPPQTPKSKATRRAPAGDFESPTVHTGGTTLVTIMESTYASGDDDENEQHLLARDHGENARNRRKAQERLSLANVPRAIQLKEGASKGMARLKNVKTAIKGLSQKMKRHEASPRGRTSSSGNILDVSCNSRNREFRLLQ